MLQVFLVCSGLGHIKRGFESFAQECFEALAGEPSLHIILYKGGGNTEKNNITLWNLPRNSRMAKQISKLIGRDAYTIEQASFALSLLPHIFSKKPDIIYFSDPALGKLLFRWRNFTKQPYKLLLSNGGPIFPPILSECDCVQQLTPSHLQKALDGGWPADKQILVPYGINVDSKLAVLSTYQREFLRQKLGLPENQPLVLSVAAINKSRKRMDYLIREVAALPKPRPYLLLLGQQEAESAQIQQLGVQLLGAEKFQVRTVAAHQVADYYKIADVFVLASLYEGFGRVFLEAMSYGLPCLAHDYGVTRFVLGKEGYLADLRLSGSLSHLLPLILSEVNDDAKRRQRHLSVYERFSWEKLKPKYLEMLQKVANQKII